LQALYQGFPDYLSVLQEIEPGFGPALHGIQVSLYKLFVGGWRDIIGSQIENFLEDSSHLFLIFKKLLDYMLLEPNLDAIGDPELLRNPLQ